MKSKAYRVLIVDDDENDRYLCERAFEKTLGSKTTIRTVAGGELAIQYLRGDGAFNDRATYPFPTLIVMDLKMPGMDGLDVLQFMKSNPAWSVVPRVVLTSSSDADDVKKAYLVGASVYHCKPGTAEELEFLIQRLVEYWGMCEVPPVDEHGRLAATDSRGKIGERIAQPQGGNATERRPDQSPSPAGPHPTPPPPDPASR